MGTVNRPIGVTLLAIGAGLIGIYEIWRALIFMGMVNFTFIGRPVQFDDPQWGQVLWALIIAAIWFWVALGLWNLRAYAWTFGTFISLFTLIWGFFAVLFGSSVEAETIPWLLAGAVYLYLSYPGVRNHFIENELAMMTPEQRAAYDQLAAANAAAAAANAAARGTPAPAAPAPAPAAAPAPPAATPAEPPAPPSEGQTPT
jgi:hypothetical protein